MFKPKPGKSTIGRDPWDTVIPTPDRRPEQPPEAKVRRPGVKPRGVGEGMREAAPRVTPPAVEPSPPQPIAISVAPGPQPPAEPPPAGAGKVPGRQKLTVHLDNALVDRVKNAAYWNPRLTIARIAEYGIRLAIEQVERENGGAYPRREGELIGGRPIK